METEALRLALDTIANVGLFVRGVRGELTSEDVIIKSDGSPVTAADLAAESLVVLWLGRNDQLGSLPICGEETSDLLRDPGMKQLRARVHELVRSVEPDVGEDDLVDLLDRGSFRPEPGSRSTHWVCDPIDGTKRYISGHRYSSCLGLVVEGQLRAGAIACPDLCGASGAPLGEPDARGSLYGARSGGGAFLIESLADGSSGEKHTLEVPSGPPDASSLRIARSVGGTSLRSGLREHILDAGLEPIPVNIDNQCKYVALVTGRADVLFQYGDDDGPKCSWDFAPGVLLATEAGAEVLDRDGGGFDFDQGPFLLANRGLRACRAELMELLLSVE